MAKKFEADKAALTIDGEPVIVGESIFLSPEEIGLKKAVFPITVTPGTREIRLPDWCPNPFEVHVLSGWDTVLREGSDYDIVDGGRAILLTMSFSVPTDLEFRGIPEVYRYKVTSVNGEERVTKVPACPGGHPPDQDCDLCNPGRGFMDELSRL